MVVSKGYKQSAATRMDAMIARRFYWKPKAQTLEQRFWSKVDKSAGDDGCWLWTGSATPKGYGTFALAQNTFYAHRVSYLLMVGCIPPKMQIDHLCRVHNCVNPRHLDVVSLKENLRRGADWAAKSTKRA